MISKKLREMVEEGIIKNRDLILVSAVSGTLIDIYKDVKTNNTELRKEIREYCKMADIEVCYDEVRKIVESNVVSRLNINLERVVS